MATTKININGIQEIDLNLGGSTTSAITSPGVVTVTNDLTGEFVTHSLGPLTAGSIVMGNDSGDVTIVPGADYGVSSPGVLTLPEMLCVSSNPFPFVLDSSSTTATVITLTNDSTGFQYAIGVTGTALTVGGGGMFIEALAGKGGRYMYLYEVDTAHPVNQTGATGVWGWSSSSSALAAVADTGLSRSGVATVAIGNGTAGDASGQAQFATHLGPVTAPTGTGPTGAWCFSQDGNISFCKAGTWEIVTTAP